MLPLCLALVGAALYPTLLQSAGSDPATSIRADAPNIVLVYTDDVGYADVSCYAGCAFETPNIARLAAEGARFTDAHASAATCTPSRYALLTGSYAFRNERARILPGTAPLIIDPASDTLPKRLRAAGYATAVVGKWHLGLGNGDVDWNEELTPGPREVGFERSFIVPATGDRTPCVYVEDGRVVGLDPDDPIQVSYGPRIDQGPSGKEARDTLKMDWSHGHNQTIVNGISRIGWMTGGQAARWVDEDMADTLTARALAFIEANADRPFFLYFSTHDIHVPRAPHARFVGRSGTGARGDAMLQTDWCVGELLRALDAHGLGENTLVVFTSDNGPVLDDGYVDRANEDLGEHDPNGPLRAGKYSLFEGGTRVPFLVRWPGKITPGTVTPALFGQVDLARTLCLLAGAEVPDASFPDSRDARAALVGEDRAGRPHLVLEGPRLALREGPWKCISPGPVQDGLGPWTRATVAAPAALFHLAEDLGEAHDVAAQQVERVAGMLARLERLRAERDR
ncbi:MAG: arylsulfatase [Planctomycetota bacterium]